MEKSQISRIKKSLNQNSSVIYVGIPYLTFNLSVNLTLFLEILQNNWLSWPCKACVVLQEWRLFDIFPFFSVKSTLPSQPTSLLRTCQSWNKEPATLHTSYYYYQHHHLPCQKKQARRRRILPRQRRRLLLLLLTRGQAPTKLRRRSSAPHPLRTTKVLSSVLFYTSSTVIRLSLRINMFQNLMMLTHMIRGHHSGVEDEAPNSYFICHCRNRTIM